MSHKLYTFAEMADRICRADGRSDIGAVVQQIRGAQQRGLIKARDHGGARGAVRVTFEEFCRARLILVLVDFGLSGEELDRASSQITDAGRTVYPDGKTLAFTLKSFIEATRKGESWVLRVHMVRDHFKEGELSFSAKLMPAWQAMKPINERVSGEDPTHPESNCATIGATYLAVMKLPASDLITPLLSDA